MVKRLKVGLVFDGDCDRIAAVDGQGNFLSSQILIPILISHLAPQAGSGKEIVKTISGSDIIPKLAKSYGLPVVETAIGYKYIADRMLKRQGSIGRGKNRVALAMAAISPKGMRYSQHYTY